MPTLNTGLSCSGWKHWKGFSLIEVQLATEENLNKPNGLFCIIVCQRAWNNNKKNPYWHRASYLESFLAKVKDTASIFTPDPLPAALDHTHHNPQDRTYQVFNHSHPSQRIHHWAAVVWWSIQTTSTILYDIHWQTNSHPTHAGI